MEVALICLAQDIGGAVEFVIEASAHSSDLFSGQSWVLKDWVHRVVCFPVLRHRPTLLDDDFSEVGSGVGCCMAKPNIIRLKLASEVKRLLQRLAGFSRVAKDY